MKFVECESANVLEFTRTDEELTMLVINNLSRCSQPAELDLSAYGGYVPVEILSHNRFPSIREDALYLVTLGPYGTQSFLLEKVHPEMEREPQLRTITLQRWKDLPSR